MPTSSDLRDEEVKYLEGNSRKISGNFQVNIALIGQTGSGKSSFINALRG